MIALSLLLTVASWSLFVDASGWEWRKQVRDA